MRAAKGRSFAFFFVAISLLVSAPAFASIPRSAALDPPAIDRFALADDAIASTEVLPLHDQLARAARVSWPVESLPETRVGASLELQPLFTEPTPLLTRALHRAYADLCATSASGRTLCAGDPVNCRDATGQFGWSDVTASWDQAKKVAKRAAGGVLGVVAMATEAVVETARFIQQPPALPSDMGFLSPEEQQFQRERNAAIKQNVLHPIKSAEKRWNTTSDAVLEAEQSGNQMRSGMLASEYASGESAFAISVAEGGVGLYRLGRGMLRSTAVGAAEVSTDASYMGGEFVDDFRVNSSVEPTAPRRTVGANRAAGKQFENWFGDQLRETYETAQPQITVVTDSGRRRVIDWVTRDSQAFNLFECKASADACYPLRQRLADEEIARTGARVVGKGKPGVPGGTVIPPTPVQVKRPGS